MSPPAKNSDKKSPTKGAKRSTLKSKTILPSSAGAAALSHGTTVVATRGFEVAVLTCKKKVEEIAKECRIANRKYRDSHFDLSWGSRYCLDGPTEEKPHLNPAGTLRVGVRHIFGGVTT